MMYPHVMQLREPWERSSSAGGVRFRRGFNWLAKLDQREQVWLVVEVTGLAKISMNGSQLGEILGDAARGQFEVTSLLEPRNEIIIDVRAGGDNNSNSLDNVAIEVRLGPAEV